jgi:hypothetical protein
MAGNCALYVGMALICVAIGVVIWHLSVSVNRLFKKEVAEKFRAGSPAVSPQTDLVAEDDIALLPQPAQKYMRWAARPRRRIKVVQTGFV